MSEESFIDSTASKSTTIENLDLNVDDHFQSKMVVNIKINVSACERVLALDRDCAGWTTRAREYTYIHTYTLASYPGSNYAGEEKRAWYILLAHALSFARVRASEWRKTSRYE